MGNPRVTVPSELIRSGKNTSGSAIAKGTFVKYKATPTVPQEITPTTAVGDALLGVTMYDVADGDWVDVQIGGIAVVVASAAIAVGARVTTTATGTSVTAASTNQVYGIAVTVGAAATLHEVELSSPTGGVAP